MSEWIDESGRDYFDRFWSKVDAEGDCWEWMAGVSGDGYGAFKVDGRKHGAHRVAYENLVGPIQGQIDHLCRNALCVNPAHLEDVPQRENLLRGHGRAARAARQTHCKRGHRLAGDNLRIKTDGHRECRECRRRYERQRATRVSHH